MKLSIADSIIKRATKALVGDNFAARTKDEAPAINPRQNQCMSAAAAGD